MLLGIIWINQNSYSFWHKAWRPNCVPWESSALPRCCSWCIMKYFSPSIWSHCSWVRTGSLIPTETRNRKQYTWYVHLGTENRHNPRKLTFLIYWEGQRTLVLNSLFWKTKPQQCQSSFPVNMLSCLCFTVTIKFCNYYVQ